MTINALKIVKYPDPLSYRRSWMDFWEREGKFELTYKLYYFERFLLCISVSNEHGIYWRCDERAFIGPLTQFFSMKFTSKNTSRHVQNWSRLPRGFAEPLCFEILKSELWAEACTRGYPEMFTWFATTFLWFCFQVKLQCLLVLRGHTQSDLAHI